jgi:hypothetical protein
MSAGVRTGDGLVQFTFDQITPVPEPSTLTLCAIGACVAGVKQARRRRSKKPQNTMA